MLEAALHTRGDHAFEHFDAERPDLKFLERQTQVLEAVADELGALSSPSPLAMEAYRQYAWQPAGFLRTDISSKAVMPTKVEYVTSTAAGNPVEGSFMREPTELLRQLQQIMEKARVRRMGLATRTAANGRRQTRVGSQLSDEAGQHAGVKGAQRLSRSPFVQLLFRLPQ